MNVDDHYKNIASNYNYLYEPRNRAMAPSLIDKLELQPDDRLLDLGAATGQLAMILRHAVGLKNHITCVEPCDSFLEHIYKLDGLDAVPQKGEKFCDELYRKFLHEQDFKTPFNKVLISQALHHFIDPLGCMDKIIQFLPKGAVIVNAELPNHNFTLPLTNEHIRHICTQPTISTDEIIPHLRGRHDVITELYDAYFTCQMKKGRWYDMIRGRFLSYFKDYTDEELEEYIEVLEKEKFEGVGRDDDVTVKDHFLMTKIIKQ